MIIRRYLIKEITISFFSILLILTMALLSQQFVRYLNYVTLGKAPANAVFSLVGFEIPYLFVFLLPLSIYLSILWVYSRLQIDNEMLILEMSGFGIKQLTKLTLVVAFIVATMVLILMFWVNPWATVKRQSVLGDEENASHLIQTLIPGRFHISTDEKRVIYVESLSRDRKQAGNIFIAEQRQPLTDASKEQWDIVTAHEGVQIENRDKLASYFVLMNGHRYEGVPGQSDYSILKFNKYALQLPNTNTKLLRNYNEELTITQLLTKAQGLKLNAELQWRIGMPLLTVVLSLIALSFSYFSPRQNLYKRILPAIVLFIVYVNLVLLSKRWIEAGFLSPWLGLWWIHAIFMFIAFYFIRLNYYRRG